MYAVNEVIEAKFFLIDPATGSPATGKTVTSVLYDEADQQHSTPTVSEIGNGFYSASFTPDAIGEWTIRFYCASLKQYGALCFPVGKGIEADIEAKVDTVDTVVDLIKAKTDLIGASVAPASEYDTEMTHLDEDISTIIQQVALTGHPANSIGKIFYELYINRLTSARASYLDNLSSGAVALASVATEGRLAELDSANIPSDVDELIARKPTPVVSSYTVQNNTNEQTLIELQPSVVTKINSFWIDTDALTQTCTIKVYSKIDGTNYREMQSMRLSGMPPTVPAIVLKEVTINSDFKITIQMAVSEGSTRNLPYRYFKEEY